MGLFGKLMFWKKKDSFDDLSLDVGKPDLFKSDFGSNYSQSPNLSMNSQGFDFQQNSYQNTQQQPIMPQFQPQYTPPFNQSSQFSSQETTNKNLEVISSKLDALRATLDSINQRLTNIETIARGEEENRLKKWRY